jgi:hypothetical protein
LVEAARGVVLDMLLTKGGGGEEENGDGVVRERMVFWVGWE